METRRTTATRSPRSSNRLRMVANKQSVGSDDELLNCVRLLQRREISSKPNRCFNISYARQRFRSIFLQEEYDIHDPKGQSAAVLPFLRRRTKVIEIAFAHGIVFALVQSGVCAAFSRAGSITISNFLTGKCLAKINAGNTRLPKKCKCSCRRFNLNKHIQATKITSTVEDALKDITALFYEEERNEIYTGNKTGLLHVWSN